MLAVAYCQSRKGCNMKNNEYNVEQCNHRFVCIDINPGELLFSFDLRVFFWSSEQLSEEDRMT